MDAKKPVVDFFYDLLVDDDCPDCGFSRTDTNQAVKDEADRLATDLFTLLTNCGFIVAKEADY